MASDSKGELPPYVPNAALSALLGGSRAPTYSAPVVPKSVPSYFYTGNTATQAPEKGNNWYRWKLYISRDEFKLTPVIDFIQSVTITLPLGYQKQGPVTFDLKPDDDLALTCERFGYGEADIKLKIVFADATRKPYEGVYTLSYAKSIQGVKVDVPPAGSASATTATATTAVAAAPAAAPATDAAATK